MILIQPLQVNSEHMHGGPVPTNIASQRVAVALRNLQTKLHTWRWPVRPKYVVYLNTLHQSQLHVVDKIYQKSLKQTDHSYFKVFNSFVIKIVQIFLSMGGHVKMQ
jgi:hypothetical protein